MTLMDVLMFFVTQIIGNAGIFYGTIALIGLILLRRKPHEILTGFMRTMIGFFILIIGAGALTGMVDPIAAWTKSLLGVEGVIPQNWLIFAKAMSEYGTEVAFSTLIGFIINLILARVTPWKGVYITGHIMMIYASFFVGVAAGYGFSSLEIILVSSIACGLYYWVHTSLTWRFMKDNDRLTPDWGLGIGEVTGVVSSCWLSKLIGKREQNTEELPFPKSLVWLRDPMLAVGLFVTPIYFILGLLVGPEAVGAFSGGTNWVIYLLLTGLQFSAALAALLYGVRMVVAELIPAFKGFSEKLVPGSVGGLDYPTMFQFAPTGMFIGFVTNLIGGILATVVMVALKFPVIMLPAIWMNFWTGALLGVFTNAYGGLRATIIVPFIWGFIAPFGWALMYPYTGIFVGVGSFDYTDAATICPIYVLLVKFLAGLLGKA